MDSEESDFDCGETIERLYHFLDGELTDDRRVAIQQHLDDCAPCFHAFDFEAELRLVIANKCKDHVPESLRARVDEALEEEERREGATG